MANEPKTAQVRIKPGRILAEGTGGAVVWMTPTKARMMVDADAVELIGARELIGPKENQALAGPSEKKAESSAEGQTGPSTDSQPSSQSGAEESQPSSAEDLRSQDSSATSSAKRGKRAK